MLSSRWVLGTFAAVALACAVGCANVGEFVWVDDFKDMQPAQDPGPYILAPGDVLQVRVFKEEGMSARTQVRSDGKISLPFLNDVQAAGYEPAVLAQQLTVRLKDFMLNPTVTISVEEQRKMHLLVVGEVKNQGVVTVLPGAGVLEALVMAGGLTDFAHRDRIFVVRPEPSGGRIRFAYESLLLAKGKAGSFRLRARDQVVVE